MNANLKQDHFNAPESSYLETNMQEEAKLIDVDGLTYDDLSGLHIKTQ